VRADEEAVERVVWPETLRVPDEERLVVEALPSVVYPVTSSVPPIVSLPVTVEVPTVCVLAAK
jgi:hypothetical protein